MIRVAIDPHALTMQMDGHAGFDVPGRDIVCAAASMLALTLVCRCLEIAEPEEIAEQSLQSGNAQVKIAPKPGREAQFTEVFSTIRAGFEALSTKYPEYVNLQ